jgi:hypothetical protein
MGNLEPIRAFMQDYTTQLMAGKAMEELLGGLPSEVKNHTRADTEMAKSILNKARIPMSLHNALLEESTNRAKKIIQENFDTIKHTVSQAVNHYGGRRIDSATFHKYRKGGVYEK